MNRTSPWTSGLADTATPVCELASGEAETPVDRLKFVVNCARAEVIALFDRWGSFTPSSISEWDASDYPTETFALRYISDIAGPLVAACAISHRKTIRRGGRNGSREETKVFIPLFVTHRGWRRLHLGQYLVQLILEVFHKRRIDSVLVPSVQGALHFWQSGAVNAVEVSSCASNEPLHALSYKSCTLLRIPTRLRSPTAIIPDATMLAERIVIGALLDGARYESLCLFKRALIEANPRDWRFHFPSTQGILFDAVQRKDSAEAMEVVSQIIPHVDVNECDHIGQSAIFYCCNFDDRVGLAKYLVSNRADPHLVDSNGQTCLFYAVKGGNKKMLTGLTELGCSLNHFDNNGHRPLHYALSNGHYSLLSILLRKKAGLNIGDLVLTPTERELVELAFAKNGDGSDTSASE